MKILAVDDDKIVRDLLKEILVSAEYGEVQTCESAERALELIAEAKKPYTCFLLDIQMPGMDGIELCRKIRETPQHAETPILMLTSMSEKSYIDRAFSAGASDYLTKPLDATEIIVRLGIAEQLVNERKSLAESADVIDSLIEVLDRTTQHDLDEAIDLGKMDRLLRYPAFENYLYQSGRSALFRTTVFAAKIRNVETLHRILPPLEFKNFLRSVAAAIIDRLDSYDAYIAYRGAGEFGGVIPRKGQHVIKALGEEITVAIAESEGKHTAKLPPAATVVLAPGSPIRLPTRGELSKATWTAIENVRLKANPVAAPEPKRRFSLGFRDEGAMGGSGSEDLQDDLRAEFAQLLREQLNTEVGEHPKLSLASDRKSPPSIFKKRQNKAKRQGSGDPSKAFPGGKSKKVENPFRPGSGDATGILPEDGGDNNRPQGKSKKLNFSNG